MGRNVLKRRIIPVQLLIDGRLVKTTQFDTWRDVGDPVASSKVYSDQSADELIFLNIHRKERSVAPLLPLLEAVSEVCFMPLTLGGGIRTREDAATLIRCGADKIVINSQAYRNPDLLRGIADDFGSQALIVGIDVRESPGGGWTLYSDCGRSEERVTLADHVESVVEAGAGEIFVNAIHRDGTMSGYDVALLNAVSAMVDIPVIGCGGAGNFEHLRDAFLASDIGALACGSLFNFGDNNPLRAKAFLTNYGIPFKVV